MCSRRQSSREVEPKYLVRLCLVILVWFPVQTSYAAGVNRNSLAVVVNMDDPLSVKIADYYQKKRGIPDRNIIRIRLGDAVNRIAPEKFSLIKRQIYSQTSDDVQGYALAWTAPYRVGCMSITSAISLGYDQSYCARGCKRTETVPYYNSVSRAPYDDYGIRPSMMLAAGSFEQARKLIDTGVASDSTRPAGMAYLLNTSDRNRNVRTGEFGMARRLFGEVLNIRLLKQDYLSSVSDVLFYFTGVARVKRLESLGFVPGAVADHLTSTGGMLTGSRQMSSLRWLEAGATASYGTVVEPCNFIGKFPDPAVLMLHYLNGDTVLEAYWKSVLMPGQGVFIGEPLARPYKNCELEVDVGSGVMRFKRGKASVMSEPGAACRT